ncbi:type IIB DNA topoisomerase [Colletotrichum graminicola M1.001]|uniref:DNA topoisomerase (ATP-hydrolyzing) n=1 Tax=Colletotrichum graminicola (strain M1.001 / M2 / FGSC 10212) TaxID=645133 RepID=E3QTT4_COLGM|nr:type IIB DNA topoisomerase [Colletotrichum graminicola M1.001]EFQ34246.1 type IIB DNA topoisomerase [Colletotrichum graminicola M1.001]
MFPMDYATSPMINGSQQGRLTSHLSHSSNVVTIPDHDPQQNTTGAAIAKLEDILAAVRESLSRNEEMSIPYRSRRSSASRSSADPARSRTPRSAVRFPGRTVHEATKFSRLMRILQMSLCTLMAGRTITKRNIYYQDENLFKKQSVVDNLVDDLAYTLGLGREDLGIVATGKGLVAGPILIRTKTHHAFHSSSEAPPNLDASSSATGVLIPPARDISQIDFGRARWVLATFRTLAAARYWDASACGSGILVTGKGYPDLLTKQFLHLIHDVKPELPIMALVDYDSDGIAIMRCYSHGSRGHAHERNTVVPSMSWLGIKSGDLAPQSSLLYFQGQVLGGSQRSTRTGLFEHSSSLTKKDRKSAARIIMEIGEDGADCDIMCRRELQVMLFLGIKAEIQAVDDAGDMSSWLDRNMRDHLFTC